MTKLGKHDRAGRQGGIRQNIVIWTGQNIINYSDKNNLCLSRFIECQIKV